MGERKPLILRYIAVDELVPYARNARKHPPAQIASLAGIIRQFGFRSPVLIDGARSIIAGHGRVLAAKQAGLAEVPTIDCSDLSAAEVRALRLASPTWRVAALC